MFSTIASKQNNSVINVLINKHAVPVFLSLSEQLEYIHTYSKTNKNILTKLSHE